MLWVFVLHGNGWGCILTTKSAVLAVFLGLGIGLLHQARSETAPWPLQLEMRVPFEPSAFPSAGRTYLAYELYLTNFSKDSLALLRVEVLDAETPSDRPIAAFEGAEFDALLQPVGARLAPGGSVVVFIWVAFEPGVRVPNKLRHRVVTADATAEGAVIGTHHTALKVLGNPVQGSNWLASDAPSNDADKHSRRLPALRGLCIGDIRGQHLCRSLVSGRDRFGHVARGADCPARNQGSRY